MNKSNNSNLYIFNKSMNNTLKVTSFKDRKNYLGSVKYFPTVSKE